MVRSWSAYDSNHGSARLDHNLAVLPIHNFTSPSEANGPENMTAARQPATSSHTGQYS